MDFNLDGDFDKLSSLKVDMPDLDFSCPSKKAAKPKERSKGEPSGGNRQGKRDCFTFSFDFNELDNFNFDSTLMKEGKTSTKNPDSEGVASDRRECKGSEINLAGSIDAFDDGTKRLPASESAMTSMVPVLCHSETSNLSSENLPSRSESSEDPVFSHEGRTSPEKNFTACAEEMDQGSLLSVKVMPTEPSSPLATEILSVQYPGGNDSTQDTVPDAHIEVGSLGTKVNTESSAGHDVNGRMVAGIGFIDENSQPKNSSPLWLTESESNKGGSEKADGEIPKENMVETEPAVKDLKLDANSSGCISLTIAHDCKASNDNQNSTSKLLVPLESQPVVDKAAAIKEKESRFVRSKFFGRSEETKSKLCQLSSTGREASSFRSKGTDSMPLTCPASGKREGFNASDSQFGRKLVGDTKSVSTELIKGEAALLGSEMNGTILCNIREGFNCDGNQNGQKMVVNPKPPDNEVTKADPVVQGIEKNVNDLNNFGHGFSPAAPASSTDKATRSFAQASIKSTVVVSSMGSIPKSKTIDLEGIASGRRIPDISSLKILRTPGASNHKKNAMLQKETNFLRNSEKNMEVQGNTESEIVHPVANVEKKMPLITSLKRKTFEASSAELVHLTPHKRLSQSPSGSRNFKEPLESVVDEQVCSHDNRAEPDSKTKKVLYDHETSGLDMPREVNMKELEIPLVMENDGNVEKAEAYAKELEDICNMLKKKHEEAKELLVRAIVNNNHLLMLNHPIFDVKIRKVEKFAARLLSN